MDENEFETMETSKFLKTYWEGHHNKLIRLWIYTQRGLQMLNEFKYLLAAIISGYVILKLNQPVWMVVVGLASLPPLIILGRWQLRKVGKVEQWIGTEYGNVLKWKPYNILVKQLELFKEILKTLEEIKQQNAKRDLSTQKTFGEVNDKTNS